jgi:FkbM family methyltransferase
MVLKKSIQELKRLTYTEGVYSSLRFCGSSLDKYMLSHLAQRFIYNRRKGYVFKKLKKLNINMILIANSVGISQELMYKGSHEPLSTKILRENLHEDMRIVDIGANLGYYALQEAKAVGPEGLVYAIEPVPHNYFILKHNVALNNLGNIQCFNLAIGDIDGSLELFLGKASNWGSAIKTPLTSNRKITVPSQRLDTFLKDKGKVDLVRMDVEGYETKIVESMTETLKQKNLMLFMEIHSIFLKREPCKALLQMLESYGFAPFAVVVGSHPCKLAKKVTDMKSLINNRYLMNMIFHAFFKN